MEQHTAKDDLVKSSQEKEEIPGSSDSMSNAALTVEVPSNSTKEGSNVRAPSQTRLPKTNSEILNWPRWTIIVLSILSSVFLFALDNTIVADVQPKIIERFDGVGKLPWMSVAFSLGALSVNLVW